MLEILEILQESTNRESKMKGTQNNQYSRSQSVPEVYNKVINILFLGAAKVGKTCLVRKLIGKGFVEDYVPTVYDVYNKEVDHENGRFIFQITDMSGYYSFPPMRRLAITNCSVFVLVHEIGNKKSYAELQRLKDEIVQLKNSREIAIIIIENKSDLVQPGSMRDVEVEDSIVSGSFCCLKVSARTSDCMDKLEDTLLAASNQITSNAQRLATGRKKTRQTQLIK